MNAAPDAVTNAGAGASNASLAREEYSAITLYAPGRAPCALDLSDNTNLWGVPPAAARAVASAAASRLTRYPSLYARELRSALADYLASESLVELDPDSLVTGCGSDDVLDSAIRAFARPGDTLAYMDPTFPMIPTFARMNGLVPLAVPLSEGIHLDADAILRTGARIIYLCSPNNPTGVSLARGEVERVVRHAPGLVILDEAYAEFSGGSFMDLVPGSDRLLVTRTMSKAFGLAGLRVGYAAGSAGLIAEVQKSRGPYKVNALAERAALAALREDLEWVRERAREAISVRERLVAQLGEMGREPLRSAANFVLVPLEDAERIAEGMRALGVGVRAFGALTGIGSALRITVGPWEMMEAALKALDDVLAGAASPGTADLERRRTDDVPPSPVPPFR